MRRSIFRQIFYIIMAYTLIAGCAKVSTPTGGPKDIRPPLVVKTAPAEGATYYTGKRIEITFDEYVVLDKINEKFMVSPPMKKRPEVTIKGKSVVVEYEDNLLENTTYTFNFSDAVKDINEGNIYQNLQFVFSTGPVIDSLSVTGNILNGYVLDAPENAFALLYRDLSPMAVRNSIPDYIARTDKNGYFRIDNVRAGKYMLYGLKDNDNSRNFNIRDELFAFLGDSIEVIPENNYIPVVPDTIRKEPLKPGAADTVIFRGEHKLIMFQHEKAMIYLTSSTRELSYLLRYSLSLPPGDHPVSFSIPGSREGSFYTERSKNCDSLTVWLTDSTLFRSQEIMTLLTYPFTDSTGAVISRTDTIAMRFMEPRTARTKGKPQIYQVRSNITGGNIKPGQKIFFESSTPLRQPDTSRIRLYEIREAEKISIPFNLVTDSTNSCRIGLNATLEQGKNYLYIADSAAFGNIYGESADSTGIRINVREEKSFGKLVLNVKGHDGRRIIQLLDKTEKLIRQTVTEKDGKVEFPLIDKGIYRIRVIYDLNNDGKWTTGNFNAGLQPEPVSFYPQEIEIKEDWVVDQDWDISARNVKKLTNVTRQSTGR